MCIHIKTTFDFGLILSVVLYNKYGSIFSRLNTCDVREFRRANKLFAFLGFRVAGARKL